MILSTVFGEALPPSVRANVCPMRWGLKAATVETEVSASQEQNLNAARENRSKSSGFCFMLVHGKFRKSVSALM